MRAPGAVDYVAATKSMALGDFMSAHPWPFLVGEPRIRKPRMPAKTAVNAAIMSKDDLLAAPEATLSDVDEPPAIVDVFVAPVRKRQDAFESMITVGRTANNDIVLADVSVSRFHAYFRVLEDRVELTDAESRNGTKLRGVALRPKETQVVAFGDPIVFGSVELVLLDARACWHRLRAPKKV